MTLAKERNVLLTRWRFETAQEMVSIIQTLSLPEVALASLASDPSPDFRLSAAFCLAGCRVTMKHRIRCRTASQCCLSSKPRQGILEHGTRVFMERQGNYFLSALAFPRPLFGICALVVVRYAIWGCVCLGSPFWGVSATLLKTPPPTRSIGVSGAHLLGYLRGDHPFRGFAIV